MSEARDYFFEIHSNLPREGPGSTESTLKALSRVSLSKENPRIADMGCGPGRSALLLAQKTGGTVSALDLHQPFLDALMVQAAKEKLDGKITPVRASMDSPPFEKAAYDLIWSEGAIYHIGLQRGLSSWRPFVKPGGYVAVSHLSWLKETPSALSKDFWQKAYPEIDSVDANTKIFSEEGFELVDHFASPASDWWDEYYAPMEQRISDLRRKYPGNAQAQSVADQCQEEIDVWKAGRDDYSYVFYVARLDA